MSSVNEDKINQSDRPEFSKNVKSDAQGSPYSEKRTSDYKDDSTGKISDSEKKSLLRL